MSYIMSMRMSTPLSIHGFKCLYTCLDGCRALRGHRRVDRCSLVDEVPTDMCMDMCIDMHMCMDTHVHRHICICAYRCAYRTCVDMRIDMHMDMHMCMDMSINRHVHILNKGNPSISKGVQLKLFFALNARSVCDRHKHNARNLMSQYCTTYDARQNISTCPKSITNTLVRRYLPEVNN